MRVRKRLRRVKRLVYLGGIVGTGFAARQAKVRRDARTNLGPPATWPPLESSEPPVAAVGDLVTAADTSGGGQSPAPVDVDEPVVSDEPVAAVGDVSRASPRASERGNSVTADDSTDDAVAEAAWVDPENDGSCPLSHPIKANTNSGIYHQPGGQFYERTRAERCYQDPAAAEADGYRAAKSS